jgi:hypothetical protein
MSKKGLKMNVDGNLEALRRYENQIDKQEILYEEYIEEMNDSIGYLIDELIDLHRQINDKYGFEDKLVDFVAER